ncbi:MAG TPA: phosphatase PAP2 family protein [Nanoarchaeota archaeon]|nr:phosphatase PAP2 family protein [Nanoarchaeota archaeon]
MTFSALPVIDREFPRIKIFWIVFALLIIFSRLYFGVHFLSDVVAGALLGYLSGFLFVRTWENHVWKGNKKMGVRAHGRK